MVDVDDMWDDEEDNENVRKTRNHIDDLKGHVSDEEWLSFLRHHPVSKVEAAYNEIEALRAENARMRQAMHDIYEVYAGSEGFKPETCPEAYLQERILEMAYIATKHKRAAMGENDE